MSFSSRYKTLNTHQRHAVDTTEGPVMVVAGPGTGKTELLGMRAANILRQTDSLPQNILCLTFTESGAVAMQQRLIDIIGRDGYNVAIHTFHSFGSEIIGKYREYFYHGAEFRPSDDLNRHRIISGILDTLRYDDPLASTMNGEYTAVSAILSAISDIKRAGLTDAELLAVLDANDLVTTKLEPLLQDIFQGRVSKSTPDKLAALLPVLANIDDSSPLPTIPRLSQVMNRSLQRALAESAAHPKVTPPITTWKNQWLTKNADNQLVLKATRQHQKLRSLSFIYSQYLKIMEQAKLYDYDDMIMQVVHAMEVYPELRYTLQEQYHYLMVDEFQDTNLAQMRILSSLTNNPVSEGSPNILVVGDDDQAIYGFQGADVGNILSFRDTYPTAELITLTDNYRSVEPILEASRQVITQGTERLERHIPMLDKTLRAHATHPDILTEFTVLPTTASERAWVTDVIAQRIAAGAEPHTIAVLSRKHEDLEQLAVHLRAADVPVQYDKRDNILEDEVILQLEQLSRVLLALQAGNIAEAESELPHLLSHPAWNISAHTIWQLSLQATQGKKGWLEIMSVREDCQPLFQWLITTAQMVDHQPLERMLDTLIGVHQTGEYISPLMSYFFSDSTRTESASQYLIHLQNLTTIRQKLREHDPDTTQPRLTHFVDFIQQHRQMNTGITSLHHVGGTDSAVQLMTAHGSKGLEFDTVFILNATEHAWGGRGAPATISFPENLRLRSSTSSDDERLRLFFVAMTRAKRHLLISAAQQQDSGKSLLPASFLTGNTLLEPQHAATPQTAAAGQSTTELQWYAPILELPQTDMQSYLATTLSRYKLSATHLNNFLDVSRGGPQYFLLNNLLRFPSAMNAAAIYGNVIHRTLQHAHDTLRAHGQLLPEEDLLGFFESELRREQLTPDESDTYLTRGSDALHLFLSQHQAHFTASQRAEVDFRSQNVHVGDAHLTGTLDVVDFHETDRTAYIIDYKTGAPLTGWARGTAYQRVKAHKYQQQLLFYKLLVEHSRDWRSYTVTSGTLQFVEPQKGSTQLRSLSLDDYPAETMERFTQLVQIVWRKIHALDFPDTTHYEPSAAGIVAFEDDLLAGNI
jgi:DNA helicase-2/ATP-dependent DNA helicase PcrA